MIVFSVAFGESYIRKFFTRCLPSAFPPGQAVDVGGEKIEVALFTLHSDVEIAQRYAAQCSLPGTLSVYGVRTKQITETGVVPGADGVWGGALPGGYSRRL